MTRPNAPLIALLLGGFIAGCGILVAERFEDVIESDLAVELDDPLEVVDHETYGWTEEGGDRALVQLFEADCRAVAQKLGPPEDPRERSDAYDRFVAHQVTPETLRTHFVKTEELNSRTYALDDTSCILYLQVHWE